MNHRLAKVVFRYVYVESVLTLSMQKKCMLVVGRRLRNGGGLLHKGRSSSFEKFAKKIRLKQKERMVYTTIHDDDVDSNIIMDAGILPLQLTAAEAMSHLDHMCALDINSRASYVRLSGIICTIGKSLYYI
nr:unnamed protein product [Callosobruchus analis]